MVPGKTTKLWLKRYEGTNIYIFEQSLKKVWENISAMCGHWRKRITKSLYLVRFTQSVRQYVIQTIVPDF